LEHMKTENNCQAERISGIGRKAFELSSLAESLAKGLDRRNGTFW